MATKWSTQQEAIFAAAETGDNVLVVADAGTGKSTTMMEIARRREASSLMLSFNQDIKVENAAKAKAAGFLLARKKVRNRDEYTVTGYLDVKTFHGWGASLFPRKKEVNPYKVDDLCAKEFGRGADAARVAYVLKQIRGRGFLSTEVVDLVAELRDPEYVAFGTETTDYWIRNADHLSELLKALDANTKVIDFDDMCRLPVLNRWIERFKRDLPDVLYLDEIQDLNPDQRRMVSQAIEVKPSIQVIAVGDDKQAIYGFRGASGAMRDMRTIIQGVELPLNTTYRCQREIVEFVNSQVDSSEMVAARSGGEVVKIRVDEDSDDVYAVEDILAHRCGMVISSRNSTLISIWLEMFLNGTDASLKGSGVISGLKQQIASVSTYNWREFVNTLKLIVRNNKRGKFVDTHADAAKALLEIIDRLRVNNKHELYKVLEQMNLKDTGIKLETVHSAKGREDDRVCVISDWWSKDDQRDNLRYVAFSRAKSFLLLVKPAT